MWKAIQKAVLSPTVDDSTVDQQLKQVKAQLPTPVFWMLGKAQSGKTSLIRAMTGNDRAEIGDGMRPCTRTAYVYDFPNTEECFLKFLDTRGLGEVDYDPSEDIAAHQEQAHLLVVVMKAMDHTQLAVMQAVRTIIKSQPHWPVIVIQTGLHEGYPDPSFEHISPYPYHHTPWPETIPEALSRSLLKQRELFKDIDARFVVVDFTLPEDGYDPVYYGIEALWNTLEDIMPQGIAAMIHEMKHLDKDLHGAYGKAALPHIVSYALIAGVAGTIPAPFVDVPLVTLIQAKLLQSIASLYDYRLNRERLTQIGAALGISFLTNLGRRQLVKFVPFYGPAASSLLTGAATYALGKTLSAYFYHIHQGGTPDPKVYQAMYAEQFKQGQQLLKDYLADIKRSGSK